MIPTTFGAVIAFLALVAPGLIFQIRRESVRPTYEETTFRELSRVALTSLILTLVSLGLLAVFRVAWPRAFLDPRAWLIQGRHYVEHHFTVVAFTLGLEVVLACLLALAASAALSRRIRASISPFGVWYQVLRRDRPPETRAWIRLHLVDGTELAGLLRHYTESRILANQEIAIGGPQMTLLSPQGSSSDIGQEYDAVVVRGEHIAYMAVRYQDRNRNLMRRRTRKSPQGKSAGRTGDEL